MTNKYPNSFFSFASSGKGSVKTIGAEDSGWTGGDLIYTRLLKNLDTLASKVIDGEISSPICIYLVGGPGNGKTEAAEHFLRKIYGGILPTFETSNGHKYFKQKIGENIEGIVVVEDATPLGVKQVKEEVTEFALRSKEDSSYKRWIYLCCINRGVLVSAINFKEILPQTKVFIETLSDLVAVGGTGPNMWPLAGNKRFPPEIPAEILSNIYVWPMDAESLLDANLYGGDIKQTPVYKLYESLFMSTDAQECTSCSAREGCPFYENLLAMKSGKGIEEIIYCLYAFEIVSGKKILFRDLLSIAHSIFVNSKDAYVIPRGDRYKGVTPCEWVRHHLATLREDNIENQLASAFKLASKRYNQVLFSDYSEFTTKVINAFRTQLGKKSDITEFKAVKNLLKAVADFRKKEKLSPILEKLACKMDVALEEGIDSLEKIEIGFCSSTKIGNNVALQEGVTSTTLLNLLNQLIRCEDKLGERSFEVSTEEGEICRKCLHILQVLGSRMAKREVGITIPAVCAYTDVNKYVDICFNEDISEEIASVRRPLENILSLKDKFSTHVLQSIGQTHISDKYVFTLSTIPMCKIRIVRSQTICPISLNAPVDPTPFVEIKRGEQVLRFPLTFSLFYALRRIREGLNIASISEKTFVSLNLLSSKLLGIITHHTDEPEFEFPNGSHFVWAGNNLIKD